MISVRLSFAKTSPYTSGLAYWNVDDNIDSTIEDLAQVYRYYRVTALTLRRMSDTQMQVLQWVPGTVGALPSASASLDQFGGESCAFAFPRATVPTTLRVHRDNLKGAHNWYTTGGDAAGTSEERIGTVIAAVADPASTAEIWVEFDMTVEFTGLQDTSTISAAMRAQKKSSCGVKGCLCGQNITARGKCNK